MDPYTKDYRDWLVSRHGEHFTKECEEMAENMRDGNVYHVEYEGSSPFEEQLAMLREKLRSAGFDIVKINKEETSNNGVMKSATRWLIENRVDALFMEYTGVWELHGGFDIRNTHLVRHKDLTVAMWMLYDEGSKDDYETVTKPPFARPTELPKNDDSQNPYKTSKENLPKEVEAEQ